MSNNFYKDEYMPKVNKIGKLTGVVGVILAFSPAIALAVVYGILPKPAALLTASPRRTCGTPSGPWRMAFPWT